ncbi:LADA_0D01288g1_1 [Lachancea dasiensis]|uniref:LADA_0D01288g1_1 n=1 Tax=Lachancea dasiensis TaxID=1072105 RepID=A0A1G4J432_9SACH|nr:LADA_0D01288g1_1 [Lachancea dasiensis]
MTSGTSFIKTTKTVEAVTPRSSTRCTLDPSRDVLKVVYDVYEPRDKGDDTTTSVVNYVFLHGSGMNRRIWCYYLDKLADPVRNWKIGKVILVDQVTHGDSAVVNERLLGSFYDWSDGARDICKICMDEFFQQNGRSVFNIVVGHSMGGFQALCCPILFPGLFQSVVCIEPVVWMKRVRKESDEDITIIPPTFYHAMHATMTDEFSSIQQYKKFMETQSLYSKAHPSILQEVEGFELRKISSELFRTKISTEQHMVAYLTLNPTATWLMKCLSSINCPVLCLYGEKSRWCPPENRIYLREHIPHYCEDEIIGGRHLVNLEDPDSVIAKLTSYIKELLPDDDGEASQALDENARKARFSEQYRELISNRVWQGTPKL